MIETYLMPREQRIAHLEIHGWTAVEDGYRDSRRYLGIWNEQLQVGFAVSRSIAGRRVIRLDHETFPAPRVCDWGIVGDDILNAIDARLAEV